MEMSSPNAQKSLKIKSQNQQKINDDPVLVPLVSILLFPWSSKVLPRCQNSVPWRQNKGTQTPNGNREELKGAGGRGRSP